MWDVHVGVGGCLFPHVYFKLSSASPDDTRLPLLPTPTLGVLLKALGHITSLERTLLGALLQDGARSRAVPDCAAYVHEQGVCMNKVCA